MKKIHSQKINREYWIEEQPGERDASANSTRQFLFKDMPFFLFHEAELLKKIGKSLSADDLNTICDRNILGHCIYSTLRGREFTPSIRAAIDHSEREWNEKRVEHSNNYYLREIYKMLKASANLPDGRGGMEK